MTNDCCPLTINRRSPMTLDELKVYQLAMDLGERAWSEVVGWDRFAQDTVGRQLARAADSIAANLSEGYGRYHYRENRNFSYYSRGSLFETRTWLTKAAKRGLISQDSFAAYDTDINLIGRMLNAYIKSIGAETQPLRVRESVPEYPPESPLSNDSLPPRTTDQ
jgi:four helix bundle protein